MKITFERALKVLEAMGYELEQPEQEPVAEVDIEVNGCIYWLKSVPDNGTKLYTALREALAEQAEQEPVALSCCGYHDASAIMWNKFNGVVQCHNCGQIYAALVRTKDLTDDDLCKIGEAHAFGTECEGYENNMLWYDVNPLPAFRAVIAADREKNK